MEKVIYWPIGSCVILKNSVRKVVIIARGLATAIDGTPKYFDYGGCLYPEGLVGDQLLFFNHEDIAELVHEGYKDEDETRMNDYVNTWVKETGLEKGDIYELSKVKKYGAEEKKG